VRRLNAKFSIGLAIERFENFGSTLDAVACHWALEKGTYTYCHFPSLACLSIVHKRRNISEGRLLSSQSEQFKKLSKTSGRLEKSQPSK